MRKLAMLLLVAIAWFAACSNHNPSAAAGATGTVSGTVVERLEGPPYSYLRLKTEKGDVWVAVPMNGVISGKKVTIRQGAAIKNFAPPRVGRKFDLVVFGTMERG
jgi:hypothetical protein